MRNLLATGAVGVLLASSGSSALAQNEVGWVALTDADEVRQLVTGMTLDGKYWKHFYRADGNASYYHVDSGSMSVRKWDVKDDGSLCIYVFQVPDRVIDCFTILRSDGAETKYELKWGSGSNAFELGEPPPEGMVQIIDEIAGPMK